MLKKINKVLVSVIIIASLAVFIFSNGSKFIVPIAGYHSSKPPAQEQKYSPPTNETKVNNKGNPPSNGSVGAEQSIKRETKKPVEVTEKEIHNEVKHEIKANSIKFKFYPKELKPVKPIKPMIPKMGVGGKARLIRVLLP